MISGLSSAYRAVALDGLLCPYLRPVLWDSGLLAVPWSLPHGTVGEVTQRVIGVVRDAFGPLFCEFLFARQWITAFPVPLELDLLDKIFAPRRDE